MHFGEKWCRETPEYTDPRKMFLVGNTRVHVRTVRERHTTGQWQRKALLQIRRMSDWPGNPAKPSRSARKSARRYLLRSRILVPVVYVRGVSRDCIARNISSLLGVTEQFDLRKLRDFAGNIGRCTMQLKNTSLEFARTVERVAVQLLENSVESK